MPSIRSLGLLAPGIALAVLLVGSRVVPTGAQPATPTSAAAAACTIAPRSLDQIAALASTPTASMTPIPGGGAPAAPDVVAAVTDTVRMAVACANANDPLRSFALFTDRYLAERFGSAHPDDLGSLFAALSRQPTPAETADVLTLVDVREVRMPAENLAIASVVTENRSARYVDRLAFQLVDDRWLIDQWSPAEDGATPIA